MEVGIEGLEIAPIDGSSSLESVWQVLGIVYDPPLWQRMEDYPSYLTKVSKRGVTLVCREGEIVAGSISFYANDPSLSFTYITQLMVSTAYQGRGVGSLLLDACEQYSRSQKFSALRLQVRTDNAAARHLYGKFGFIELSRAGSKILMQKDGIL